MTKSVFAGSFVLVTAAMFICMGGCATQNKMSPGSRGWSMGGVVDSEQAAKLEKITDQDIATMLDAKVTAKLPTRIAISRTGYGYGCGFSNEIGTEELKAWEKVLCKNPQIQGVDTVSTRMASRYGCATLHDLRVQAASMNCELLLVYDQNSSSVDNLNEAAALYWTIVGLWTVPGSQYEQRTVCQAILVDCRTGKILGSAVGEGYEKTIYAAAYEQIAKDKVQKLTPVKAMDQMQQNMEQVIARVIASAKTKEPVAKSN